MATLGITDLKVGLGVNIKGKDCVILEAQHVKPGKGNTYVRTKYRDIRTGRVNEENFQQSAKFESVNMRTREMQYLYNDGNAYWFMDTETFEQIPVDAELIGDNDKFLKENDICLLQYANDVLYAVQPPTFRHRSGRHQARHHRDWCRHPGSHVSEPGRAHQGRYARRQVRPARLVPHRRIVGPRQRIGASRAFFTACESTPAQAVAAILVQGRRVSCRHSRHLRKDGK